LSIVLIAATLIISSQLSFMREGNLGYQKEQMLILRSPPVFDSSSLEKFRYFTTALRQNSSVAEITATSDIPGQAINYQNSVRNVFEDKTSNYPSYLMEIDDHFIDTYRVPMAAGRKFSSTDSSSMMPGSRPKVMINEVLTTSLGFKNAEAAVSQNIILKLGTNEYTCQVIGVVKNFHQRSMREKFDPILFYFPSYSSMRYISINVNSINVQSTLASVQTLFKTSFSAAPFEYFFLDDFFNKQYQADQRLGKVFGLFAGLAIIISCLGLLGLSSFIVNLRKREIGIRKVLGASVSSILVLFSRDFVKLVVIASAICLPVIYFGAKQWLENFAFPIGVSWVLLIIPSLFLLVISLFTVSIQSMRAALTNPTKSLRSE
ncbi:MAG TPA: FtsX-like permease family protein, partial [Flavitalea sp.]|nr:FtsX-like permease family protein [Flavitalea sp.]